MGPEAAGYDESVVTRPTLQGPSTQRRICKGTVYSILNMQLGVARCVLLLRQLERQGGRLSWRGHVRVAPAPTHSHATHHVGELESEMVLAAVGKKRREDSCALSGDDIIRKVDSSNNQSQLQTCCKL